MSETQRRADIDRLVALVRSQLSEDLLSSDQRRRARRTRSAGHCYVASETLWWLLEREPLVYQMQHEGNSHWFLLDQHANDDGWTFGMIIDPTFDQFEMLPPYRLATRRSFLTREPSKRARILLDRCLRAAEPGITET